MHKYQLLIIDDDQVLSEMLSEYLAEEGFQTDCAYDGLVGLNKAKSEDFDLIILDVMLPSLNGFEILKRLRKDSAVPVLMLTARGDDVDRIVGLEIGADDYLPKPFNTRELVARIRSILRRTDKRALSEKSSWSLGDLKIDIQNWQASYKGLDFELTSAEFRIIDKLFKQNGKPVSREELTEYALGRAMNDFDRSIDTHVSNLRKKLSNLGITELQVKGVRGIGYALAKNFSNTEEE